MMSEKSPAEPTAFFRRKRWPNAGSDLRRCCRHSYHASPAPRLDVSSEAPQQRVRESAGPARYRNRSGVTFARLISICAAAGGRSWVAHVPPADGQLIRRTIEAASDPGRARRIEQGLRLALASRAGLDATHAVASLPEGAQGTRGIREPAAIAACGVGRQEVYPGGPLLRAPTGRSDCCYQTTQGNRQGPIRRNLSCIDSRLTAGGGASIALPRIPNPQGRTKEDACPQMI
jgi:hypothetical protein